MKYCLKFVRNVSTSIHLNRIRMFACCTFNVWLATVKADIWKEKKVFRGKICSFNFFFIKTFLKPRTDFNYQDKKTLRVKLQFNFIYRMT